MSRLTSVATVAVEKTGNCWLGARSRSSGRGAGRSVSMGHSLRAGIGTTSSVPRVVRHSGHLHRERKLLVAQKRAQTALPAFPGSAMVGVVIMDIHVDY